MSTSAPTPDGPHANRLLGHPPDARLLLLTCDDLGLDESVNLAVVEAVQQDIAASCSLMTPCHAAPHALRLLRRHPEIPFGIHLTLVCEAPHLRWGPLADRDQVSSLLDPSGELYAPTPAGRAALAAEARLDRARHHRARPPSAAGSLASRPRTGHTARPRPARCATMRRKRNGPTPQGG
ncbi:ChbG/HpnK family deacetylase [Streptomyces sp. CBMA123]|uniref:ChbG/HpnK family deacetylase n=1 Tax=Streptomyces sp. CBMA123 TaxID=1896313 RepID=UPI001661CA23|nr:ChbG/HpnK family deacetylase [Streptomyces sp. CBMA123]